MAEITPPQFSFGRLIVRKAHFEEIERIPPAEGETKPKEIKTSINLTLGVQQGPNELESLVFLTAVVLPDLKWQPYKIEVSVAGIFGAQNAPPDVFDTFRKNVVPSILFPYVRQLIHTITADAVFGPVRINPINIQKLLADAWEEQPATDTTSSAPSQPEPQ